MDATKLSTDLEAALVRERANAYLQLNYTHFKQRLRAPVIALADTTSRLGAWVRGARRLELARGFVVDRPWPEVVEVLAHEMAHQFVDEVLLVHEETAHGETFRAVCAARGIDARAAGTTPSSPGASTAAEGAEVDRVLERVRKLLALAGSSNQHEAEVAMRRAHELMLRHNIAAAAARATQAFEVRHLGDPLRRSTRVEVEVLNLLVEFFFVKVIRIPAYVPRHGTRGSLYKLTGTRANVEMAVHVHGFLLATADRLWRENKGDARVRSGHDRGLYQAGVIGGFRDKLAGERTEFAGTGLVWVGDSQLDDFYRARHPRIMQRRRRVRDGAAHEAGREAGRTIVLHRPIENGPGAGAPKRLRG